MNRIEQALLLKGIIGEADKIIAHQKEIKKYAIKKYKELEKETKHR